MEFDRIPEGIPRLIIARLGVLSFSISAISQPP
jgi:hypothetical protein